MSRYGLSGIVIGGREREDEQFSMSFGLVLVSQDGGASATVTSISSSGRRITRATLLGVMMNEIFAEMIMKKAP